MSKIIKELSGKRCQQLKYNPESKKDNYLRDGHGLYLEALASGRKVWNYEFRLHGKKSRIRLPIDYGSPGGSLKEARQWCQKQRQLVSLGINPSLHARHEKARQKATQQNTFNSVADEWLEHHKPRWSQRHYQKASGIVRRELRVPLGDRVVSEITTAEVLAAIQVPEKAGKQETAHKAREFASQIFRRAIVRQLMDSDPTYPIRGIEGLAPVQTKNHPHVTKPDEVAELLIKIDGYQARHYSVLFALKMLPYVFTRPGELRQARWSEFDLLNAQWEIPAERMKGRRPHVVPLATQVIALLEELTAYNHHSADSLLFPSPTKPDKPISDATLSKALRTLGYQGKQVPHGFRHTASTLLNSQQSQSSKFTSDTIEQQLAHVDKDSIRATYNKYDGLPERRKMMQFYADYLDGLKSGNPVNVVAFKSNQK